jgi:hypothetical protein
MGLRRAKALHLIYSLRVMLVTTSNSLKRLLMVSLSLRALIIAASAALASRYDFITIYNAYEVLLQQNTNLSQNIKL